MTEKLKTQLRNALKQAGLSEGLAEGFESQDDAAVENFIKTLKPQAPSIEDVVKGEAFTKYLEEGGFDKLLSLNRNAQSAFDKKVNKALNTFKSNLIGGDGGAGEQGNTKINTGNEPGENNPVLEALQAMQAEIASLKKEREQSKKQQTAAQVLAASKLPKKLQERWVGRINLEAETPVEEQVQALEEEYTELTGNREGSQGGFGFNQKRTEGKQGTLSKSEEKELAEMAKKL